jgi:hypothetical protein
MVMATPGRTVQVASQLDSPTSGSDSATASGPYCWLKLNTPQQQSGQAHQPPDRIPRLPVGDQRPRIAIPIAVTIPMA